MALLLLVPLALILTAYVGYATSRSSHAWADALVNWMRNFPVFGAALGAVFGPLIVNGASWIANRMGKVYLGLQDRAVNWLGGLGHYAKMIAEATLTWPIDLISAVRWLVGSEIPHLIRGLPNAVTKLVHDAQKVIGGLEKDFARLYAHLPGQVRKLIHGGLIGLVGPFLLPLRWLLHHWKQIAHAAVAAGGIAVPWVYVPKIWRRLHAQNLRLTRVEKLLGVTAMGIVMARVLRVPRGCLRDGNLGKAARRLCGLDTSLFDSLLLDLIAITSVVSVVEFANDLRAVEDEAIDVLGRLVREWPS